MTTLEDMVSPNQDKNEPTNKISFNDFINELLKGDLNTVIKKEDIMKQMEEKVIDYQNEDVQKKIDLIFGNATEIQLAQFPENWNAVEPNQEEQGDFEEEQQQQPDLQGEQPQTNENAEQQPKDNLLDFQNGLLSNNNQNQQNKENDINMPQEQKDEPKSKKVFSFLNLELKDFSSIKGQNMGKDNPSNVYNKNRINMDELNALSSENQKGSAYTGFASKLAQGIKKSNPVMNLKIDEKTGNIGASLESCIQPSNPFEIKKEVKLSGGSDKPRSLAQPANPLKKDQKITLDMLFPKNASNELNIVLPINTKKNNIQNQGQSSRFDDFNPNKITSVADLKNTFLRKREKAPAQKTGGDDYFTSVYRGSEHKNKNVSSLSQRIYGMNPYPGNTSDITSFTSVQNLRESRSKPYEQKSQTQPSNFMNMFNTNKPANQGSSFPREDYKSAIQRELLGLNKGPQSLVKNELNFVPKSYNLKDPKEKELYIQNFKENLNKFAFTKDQNKREREAETNNLDVLNQQFESLLKKTGNNQELNEVPVANNLENESERQKEIPQDKEVKTEDLLNLMNQQPEGTNQQPEGTTE